MNNKPWVYWETQPLVGKRKLIAKTCNKCSEFKPAEEFRITTSGYPSSWCHDCEYRLSKLCIKRQNDASRDGAGNHRNAWTQRDLDELERLIFTEKLTSPEIATRLGRTVASITNAKHRYVGRAPSDA